MVKGSVLVFVRARKEGRRRRSSQQRRGQERRGYPNCWDSKGRDNKLTEHLTGFLAGHYWTSE